jgi:2-polyprenyl-3-methyl-5-hydroxy-6-metoxy-1,4-benzoquinol methylase|tara:strand:- start:2629 stop:3330 length:702 start_codon:yes stop_codon:yes gene_type:complete
MREDVKEFFEESSKYLEGNSTIQLRRKIINDLTDGKLYNSVLDLGCGDGSLSMAFVGKCKELTLVDFSSDMIGLAKERLNSHNSHTKISFYQSSIEEFEQDEKYDLILLFGVLAHVENLDDIVEKCKSLLNKEGTILLQNSNSSNLVTKFNYWISDIRKTRKYKVNKLSDLQIEKALFSHGLELINKNYYLSNTFGLRRVSKKLDEQLKSFLAWKQLFKSLLPEIIYEFKKLN